LPTFPATPATNIPFEDRRTKDILGRIGVAIGV